MKTTNPKSEYSLTYNVEKDEFRVGLETSTNQASAIISFKQFENLKKIAIDNNTKKPHCLMTEIKISFRTE